jgi:hypothetical protein
MSLKQLVTRAQTGKTAVRIAATLLRLHDTYALKRTTPRSFASTSETRQQSLRDGDSVASWRVW